MDNVNLMKGSPPSAQAQVTLANWRTPPFNRWAYHHVRELIPTACISRGAATVWSLAYQPQELMDLRFTNHENTLVSVEKFLHSSQTDGFLVLHQGRIVTERYFNDLKQHEPHILMSISKSLTATLAGILVSRGLLDPTRPVNALMPELADSAFADCTLQHILDMTVGIDFDEDYLADAGLITAYREVSGWKPTTAETIGGDLRSWLPGLRKSGEHGAKFHYVSPCTDLLGWIVERVSGKAFHELFSELVWEPMGAEFDGYVTVDRLGASRTAGGLCVTLRDLARFGQMWLDNGRAGTRQVVPPEWIHDTVTNVDRCAWKAGDALEFLPQGGYRNKWWITGNSMDAYTGIGVYGQWLYIAPQAQTVIAVFASQPLPVDDNLSNDAISCFEAIAQALQTD